jgi:cystathionine beta-lyase
MVGVEELLLGLTAPGDGVIINPPVYPPYFADIRTRRARRSRCRCARTARSTSTGSTARSPRARGAAALQPAQPDRARAPREELDGVAAAADAHGAWVISDEIHAPLSFRRRVQPWLTVSSAAARARRRRRRSTCAG